MSKFAAVVLSAGSGSRMKSDIPKQYMDLLGKPVIYYSLKAFQDSFVTDIVLVTGKDDVEYCRREIVEKYQLDKVCAIVPGGAQRYDSVLEGLRALGSSEADYVMIHDGARPLLNQPMIRRVADTLEAGDSCVLGMPVKDTIKMIDDQGYAVTTPDRSHLWLVQTPQAFPYPMIRNAYEKMHSDMLADVPMPAITDDAMVAEYVYGTKVKMVEGRYENLKITTPEDLGTAALYLERDQA